MRTLLLFATQPKVLILAGTFAFLEMLVLPDPLLIFILIVTMVVDLATGLLKSWNAGKATTSVGFRRTVLKIAMYSNAIIATWLLSALLTRMFGVGYIWLVNWMTALLTAIELYSVFENLYMINPKSMFSRKVAAPILKFLRGLIDKADKNLNEPEP